MSDPTLGTLTPTDPAKVLAKAAEKLCVPAGSVVHDGLIELPAGVVPSDVMRVPAPPSDEARIKRVSRAIDNAYTCRECGAYCENGAPPPDCSGRCSLDTATSEHRARAAIAAYEGGSVTSIPCKVCQSPAPLHGVVDFNKSCEAHRGRFFPLLGEEVWYRRCDNCGFLFTPHFDFWDLSRWRECIYNVDYHLFDPDGADGSRARANAPLTLDMAHRMGAARILDYGGGNGMLARLLCEAHSDAVSWDILIDNGPPPMGPFDMVTAFEVLEHTPTPLATCQEALSRVRDGGAFFFSTLTLDDLPPQAVDHPYIAPRNGHVSIHTTRSLKLMFDQFGFQVRHLSAGLHIAVRS